MVVGITFSSFDLFHAGHVLMLKEAKTHCDHLIAAIQTDPSIDRPDTKNKPIQSISQYQALSKPINKAINPSINQSIEQ